MNLVAEEQNGLKKCVKKAQPKAQSWLTSSAVQLPNLQCALALAFSSLFLDIMGAISGDRGKSDTGSA